MLTADFISDWTLFSPANVPLGKIVCAATASTLPKLDKLVKSSRTGVKAINMFVLLPASDGSVHSKIWRRSGKVCSVRTQSVGTRTENPWTGSLYVSNLVLVAAAVAVEGHAKKAAATGSVANELASHWRLVFDDSDGAVWRLAEETDDVDVVVVYAEAPESTRVAQKEARNNVENAMVDTVLLFISKMNE